MQRERERQGQPTQPSRSSPVLAPAPAPAYRTHPQITMGRTNLGSAAGSQRDLWGIRGCFRRLSLLPRPEDHLPLSWSSDEEESVASAAVDGGGKATACCLVYSPFALCIHLLPCMR